MERLQNLERLRLRQISSKEVTLGDGALLEDVRGLWKSWRWFYCAGSLWRVAFTSLKYENEGSGQDSDSDSGWGWGML